MYKTCTGLEQFLVDTVYVQRGKLDQVYNKGGRLIGCSKAVTQYSKKTIVSRNFLVIRLRIINYCINQDRYKVIFS